MKRSESIHRSPAIALVALLLACSSSSLSHSSKDADGTAAGTGGTMGPNTGGAATGGSIGPLGDAGGSGGTLVNPSDTEQCNPPASYYCTGTPAPSDLIADFDAAPGSGNPPVFGSWGKSIFGGTFVYPTSSVEDVACKQPTAYPMTTSMDGGAWRIAGTVGTYSGFGLWWMCLPQDPSVTGGQGYTNNCLLDASAYSGISFTVSGNTGPKGNLGVVISTPESTKVTLDFAGNPKTCGRCTQEKCQTNVPVPVTSVPTTVQVTWAQLQVTDPSAIQVVLFTLPDPCDYSTGVCVARPYEADVSIDDLRFIP